MKNWYDNNCKCEDGNPIIGVIINGKRYEKDAVTIEQYEKDMTALNKNNTEIRETIDVLTKGLTETKGIVSETSDEITVLNGKIAKLDERITKLEERGAEIKITSFKATPVVALAGSETDVKLTWTLNTQATSLTINGLAAAGTSYTTKVNASRSFTLVATDKNGNADTASAKIDFMNHIVYGASSDSAPTSDVISSLETKVLSEEIARTLNVNCGSGAYIYYAYPKRLGKVKFYSYGMFEGGFEDPVVIAYKNAAGYMEEYNVYRSSQKLTQTIEVQTAKEV